ncbi:MAG TPA: fused MFS/spermidine synthase [Myxococcota bacterium]|jgi:spermidine synthase
MAGDTLTITAPRLGARGPWPLYAIFFVSGCAGLVYEVMWTRSFGLVFGSTTRAAAVVLAAFFLGMAGGNWLGGRFAAAPRATALRRYAGVELAIAAAALLVIGWLHLYHAIFPLLYRATQDAPLLLAGLQLVLVAAALVPPSLGLGATLPLMSRAVVSRDEHLGRRLGFAYAVNTAGGVAGVLVSGFWLPIGIGVRGGMLLAAALNLAAALGALAAARGLAGERGPQAPEPVLHETVSDLRGGGFVFSAVAAASGLGTLALEVLYTRLLVGVMDSSVFSFALVLATFLVSLALGSALVSAVVDRLRSPWLLVAAGAGLGAVAILASPSLLARAWEGAPALSGIGGPLGAALRLLPLSFLVMGPPALLVGTLLPAIWRAAIDRAPDAGAIVGRLTGLNTLAGVIGSLLAGFLLIPALGVSRGILLVASLYAVLGVVALLQLGRSPAWRAAALGAALAFAALAGLRSWEIVPLRLPPGERLLELEEGEGATVSLTERVSGDRRVRTLTLNGRYTLGASSGQGVHRSQGELALALHGEPREVAFIGVATGMSMSSIQAHPSIRRVVAMELFPGVLRLARAFRPENGGVLDDPRVELRLADGRNHLFGTDQRFDAIVGDLFVPWHAGTGYLYTAEHFSNVRSRLAEGGVFVQWLQADQVSAEELRIVAATFSDVFQDAELWLNRTQATRPLLGLVGFRGRSAAGPRPQRVGEMIRVCGAEVLRAWSASAPRNTDDFPRIEFSAASSHLVRTAAGSRAVLAALRRLSVQEGSAR